MVIAATGFFDGVHLGHRAIIEQLCSVARAQNKKSAVVTFWPHPRAILQQDAFALRLLNSLDEKREILKSLGVDEIFVLPFCKEFSKLTSKEFLQQYLIEKYEVSGLVIGYDHKLGQDVSQTQEELIGVANSLGIETFIIKEIFLGDRSISSTKIRNTILEGGVLEASKMLGYFYSLKGVVVQGNKLGRTMGYPTANMQLYEPLKLLPGNGVYCVDVEVLGEHYKGICNVGNRPTVGANNSKSVETHILDFDEDIYGLDIKIEFIEKIRDEKKFESINALKDQINLDEEFARNRIF